jgi:hypothetical protein
LEISVTGEIATANVLWVSKSGNDSTGARGRFDLPYLTVGAAQTAASSGDTIIVLPGDYSGETELGGKDGVTYQGMDGAILPAFNVTTAITIKGSGLCQSLTCDNAGAVIDMPDMDTVSFIECLGGTLTAGNAGTIIECLGGTITAGNAGTYIFCEGGTLTIRNADQSHDGTTLAPIGLSSSGSLTIENSRHESTELNGVVIGIANNWSGSLKIFNSRLKATNAGTDGATKGINYGTGVTGSVQLINCSIITAQNGSGTAKSIDAPSAQDVVIQGTLNQTHDKDSDITFVGGSAITNTNFEA